MNKPEEPSGPGFGWAVLFFGAVWLFVVASLPIKFQLLNEMVLVAFMLVTLIWGIISVGMITTGYSPRGK